MMFDPILMVITLVFAGIGMFVSSRLKNKFHEYSQIPLSNGMSGRDVAEKMLHDNDILDVKITSVEGQLTDHYNPVTKTVNLSRDVYEGRNISSAAVAAHECGHAVQHAKAYSWLSLRSSLVPVVNISSKAMNIIIMAGFFFGFMYKMYNEMLMIIIVCQGAITLFSLITLPVELDASKRALVWLNNSNIVVGEKHAKAEDALNWAARTYFVAALASLAQLMYFIMMLLGRRKD
ncbi:MAG TPA: zinc metallopeptidase [Bacteroidia bacterium]|jgi:Zn-dependent membrane protease YugP|nr:zinc metallopeptidase [Bacteroidia bacterium]